MCQLSFPQVLQREDQISELTSEVRQNKEQIDTKEKQLDKMKFDLHNAKEDHRIATDEVMEIYA